jgi:hypothetical protein
MAAPWPSGEGAALPSARNSGERSNHQEKYMKVLLVLGFALVAAHASADQCVTTVTGRTVCRPSESAAVNPATGTVTTAQKYPSGVSTAETNTGAKAAYNPNTGAAATTQKYANGVTTAQSNSGAKAAYNPHTGNAATQQTNQNGVKNTQTSAGGQAKTKNGMGVAETSNGTKCARGANHEGCKPE